MRTAIAFSMLALLSAAAPARGITLGQVDEFSSGVAGWLRGSVATPGAGGAGDPYLRVPSGRGGNLVTFDQSNWAGDYLAAGVDRITFRVENQGPDPVVVRLAIGDNDAPLQGGSWFSTAVGVALAPGSGWQTVSFSLGPTDLVRTQGTASVLDVLGDVATLRILHSAAPDAFGEFVGATIGVDGIVAVPEPGTVLLLASGLAALRAVGRRAASGRA